MSSQVLPKKRGGHTRVNSSITNSSSPSGGNYIVGSGSNPAPYNAAGTNGRTDRRIISSRVLSKRTPSSSANGRNTSQARHVSRQGDINDSFEDAIHFNENKHTILSNFEEWIKLSTDNKITSKNSWQFQLIDYFHDMNVIKDGESINFQRASATLDGCVKIYSSRVESAATETGKLLSGLAAKKQQDSANLQEEDDDGEDGENEDDVFGDATKKKRKYNRVVESTLVPFDTIKIKKLDQELAIDPLFKKALAEFDEGGAKSLLLNTLNIDTSGRVIFDATSNVIKEHEVSTELEAVPEEDEQEEEHEVTLDSDLSISRLEQFIFKEDGPSFDSLVLCPSLGEFHNAIEDISKARSILSDFNSKMNGPVIKEEEEEDGFKEEYKEDQFAPTDQFDFDDNFGDLDANEDNNASDVNNTDPLNNMDRSVVQKLFNEPEQYIQSTVSTQVMDRDLMAYFDATMKANWRGPEHWKVAALKQSKNLSEPSANAEAPANVEAPKRKKNVQTVVDFFEDSDPDDVLFEAPKLISSITIKRSDDNDSANKLPDDIKYTSARLTNLFTKPQITILYFPKRKIGDAAKPELTDENFFAEKYQQQEEEQPDRLAASFHQAEYDDFNNDFGGDDDFGEVNFNDALASNTDKNISEEFEEMKDMKEQMMEESQVLGRRRATEYLNFSRVAKRVDVKLLKDNLWRGIKKEDLGKSEKTFGQVITTMSSAYPPEQRRDLSTSFCFICLLHLANEHDLTLTTNEMHSDLQITGFVDVES